MPRVLRILNRLIIGGPAINATYLTKYMSPKYETLLVIGGKDDHEKDASHLSEALGIEPLVIPEMKRAIRPFQDRLAYLKLKQIIREFKPDIVHTHAAKSGTIGRLAAAHLKVPVIVHTFHGHVFHSYFNKFKTNAFIKIERELAKKCSGIVAISELQKKELSEVYNICPASKIEIIPLGLNLDKMQTDVAAKRQQFRQQYHINNDEVAIGIIGRIVPVKNHTLFVAATAQLLKMTDARLKIVIIGDGDMREAMEAQFKNLGVDYTYFPENPRQSTALCTSWRTDVDVVLAGLDVVALTSHNEGTPLSLIEAQAAGKPVVSTDVGGVRDVVLSGVTGIVSEADNVEAMAQSLLTLVNDAALRTQMGTAGAAHAHQHYAYQRLVKDMDEYYVRLLANHKRKANY